MRKYGITIITLLLGLCLMLAGCGSQPASSGGQPEASKDSADQAGETEALKEETAAQKDVLVVYFSATGTTKGVAEKIAALTDADIYEIAPAQPYTEEDLNWHDENSRTTIEQNDKSARPEIAGDPLSLDRYTTVFIGYPIWWGEEPRIMDTFAESYDFSGITVIPFCTSGSSGIGESGANLEKLAGSGTWFAGERHSGNISEEELQSWINGLE